MMHEKNVKNKMEKNRWQNKLKKALGLVLLDKNILVQKFACSGGPSSA